MDVLARVAIAIAIVGCYAPDVSDCTLACATSADCADDQVCTADNLCASPSAACGGADAGAGSVPIAISISGIGVVAIGPMMCQTPGNGSSATCTLEVAPDVPATAMATAKGGEMFMAWTSPVCALQLPSCTFTPLGPTQLAVAFAKKD